MSAETKYCIYDCYYDCLIGEDDSFLFDDYESAIDYVNNDVEEHFDQNQDLVICEVKPVKSLVPQSRFTEVDTDTF